MQNWFETLSTFEKIFWYIAIPFSIIFFIQLILSVVLPIIKKKFNNYSELSEKPESLTNKITLGKTLFSLRNAIVFLVVFGWSGVVFSSKDKTVLFTLLAAFILGILSIFIFSLLYYFSQKDPKKTGKPI